MSKVRAFLQKWNPLSYAVSLYLFAALVDYGSTELVKQQHIPHMFEENIFSRGTDMQFLLWKGVVVDAILLSILTICAIGLYKLAIQWSVKAAKALAALPYLYMAWDRMYDAVLPNILFGLHMNVMDPKPPTDVLKQLLGGN